MFAKSVIDCDLFIDMPQSTRLLYYDLSMRADDDGFITPKKVIRMTGASDDDLSILIAKKFVIPFDSGVVVIRHWRVHNYIKNDRYKETNFEEEKAQLIVDGKREYEVVEPDWNQNGTGLEPECLQNGTKTEPQVRLGKDRLGNTQKENIKEKADDVLFEEAKPTVKRFVKPTLEEVRAYINEKGYSVNAEQWFSFYETNGWKVGRNPMKSWKSSLTYWNSTGYSRASNNGGDGINHGYNKRVDLFNNDDGEENPWK